MSFDPAGRLIPANLNEDGLVYGLLVKRAVQESTDEGDTPYRQGKRTNNNGTAKSEYFGQLHPHQYETINIGGSANVHRGAIVRNVIHHNYGRPLSTATATATDSADRYDLLSNSLSFDRIEFCVNEAKKALLSTCERLPVRNTFRTWYDSSRMEDHDRFVWIKYKPGCGKLAS